GGETDRAGIHLAVVSDAAAGQQQHACGDRGQNDGLCGDLHDDQVSSNPRPTLRMRPSAFMAVKSLSSTPLMKTRLLGVLYALAISMYSFRVTFTGICSKVRTSVRAICMRIMSVRAIRSASQLLACPATASSCSCW